MRTALKKLRIIAFAISMASVWYYSGPGFTALCDSTQVEKQISSSAQSTRKKILYVDSYHPEFKWVKGITQGIADRLRISVDREGRFDDANSPFELRMFHMDTKRNLSEAFMKSAALQAKHVIDTWQPDLVIASDDNASKYLIVPYFMNSSIPFVFCGIQWDAGVYGFPSRNITGVVEVILIPQLIDILSAHARGPRIGFLASDHFSQRTHVANIKKTFGFEIQGTFVKTFDEWKTHFLKFQHEVDLLILDVAPGVSGWDDEEARAFVMNATEIPTGCWDDWMTPFAMVGVLKSPEELGDLAAKMAIDILNGRSPRDIPVTTNKKAKIFLNMRIAKKLNIKFPMKLIKQATFVH